MPIYSDAARAFADRNIPRPGTELWHAAAWGFDAGQAAAQDAALATVTPAPTPRTITTSAELDALPSYAVVTDNAGSFAWQKRGDGEWGMVGLGSYRKRPDDGPWSLLVPATAAPEPERLTDPDDPRIKPGARVRVVIERTVVGSSGDWPRISDVQRWFAETSGGPDPVFLLAEAPEDPDADVLAAIRDMMPGDYRPSPEYLLEALRAANYDVVKRAES